MQPAGICVPSGSTVDGEAVDVTAMMGGEFGPYGQMPPLAILAGQAAGTGRHSTMGLTRSGGSISGGMGPTGYLRGTGPTSGRKATPAGGQSHRSKTLRMRCRGTGARHETWPLLIAFAVHQRKMRRSSSDGTSASPSTMTGSLHMETRQPRMFGARFHGGGQPRCASSTCSSHRRCRTCRSHRRATCRREVTRWPCGSWRRWSRRQALRCHSLFVVGLKADATRF